LTDAARQAAVEAQRLAARALGTGGALRLVRPEHLHMTLVFAGEVAEDRAAAIEAAMRDDIRQAPFVLVFRPFDVFPPRGAPRILHLGATAGVEAAVALHAIVADRLAPLGVARDRRPFQPHLTLGRWRWSRPSDRPRDLSAEAAVEVEVRDVVLFESHLSTTGPSYTRLTAAPLVCP
jgi:2'-5' RNA ligase